jgi:NAD dependent epimerase/dehydratase
MSGLSGRRVLVTGAGGFIGGHLAGYLVRQGASVRGMTRYNSRDDRGTLDWLEPEIAAEVEPFAGDIRDIESAKKAMDGVQIVLHLAAQIAIPYSYVNPRDFFETNVLGTLNIAQAALDLGIERVVHTSTSEVYGSARIIPITEDHPIEPQSPYAASKVGSDKLMDSYYRSYDLPMVIVRPFNTYGPHQSARAVVPTIISQALAGDTLRLGATDTRRDLTFVEDTARGFEAAATADDAVGHTIQLGTGYDVTIGAVVDMVGEVLGKQLTVETDEARIRPAKSEVTRLISDPARAAELTGWRPEVELREGLERTIAWIQQNQARYRVGDYAI